MECQHVKADGQFCKAKPIKGQGLCYFHSRDRERVKALNMSLDSRRHTYANVPTTDYRFEPVVGFDDGSAALLQSQQLPLLEDAASIQVALTSVLRALATQQISAKRGALMLYGLQVAASNLRHMPPLSQDTDISTVDPNPIQLPID